MTRAPGVRRILPADLPAVQRLTDAESWGYTAADLRRLIALSPDGFLVLEREERVRGCLSILFYGPIAWIGNVVVDAADRGRGHARALMEHALALCDARGARHVYLDAFPAARGLYDKLGFVEEARTDRWCATLRGDGASNDSVGAIPLPALDALVDVDARIFGGGRRALWRALLSDFPGWCWWIRDDHGVPQAWIAVRAAGGSAEIGPWCGETPAARTVFEHACARLEGRTVELSAPADNTAARGVLEDASFRIVGYHIRMWRGAPVAWDRARTWGIGGLEKG